MQWTGADLPGEHPFHGARSLAVWIQLNQSFKVRSFHRSARPSRLRRLPLSARNDE